MDSTSLVLNTLTENSFTLIPQVFLDFFKEDKDSIFMLIHFINQYKYLQGRDELEEDGAFFSTVESFKNKYYISEYVQRKCIVKLENLGLLSVSRRGLPPKRFIHLNFKAISELMHTQPNKKEEARKNKKEYYQDINTNIEKGFAYYKNTIGNMNKATALSLYVWKKLYDKHKPYGQPLWEWNSTLFGVLNYWVKLQGNKPIDFNIFIKFFEGEQKEIEEKSQEDVLKYFSFWVKSWLDVSPASRLDTLEKVNTLIHDLERREMNEV